MNKAIEYVNKVAPRHDRTHCSDEHPVSEARFAPDDFGGCYRCTIMRAVQLAVLRRHWHRRHRSHLFNREEITMNNQNNSSAPNSLFARKLSDLENRGYEVTGRILHKDGEYALFDGSCRWLTQPQYQRLMHEQDGSLFASQPPADRVQGGLTLTDADIEGIAREHDVGWTSTLGSMVKFARAILSRQNSTPTNAAAANGDGLAEAKRTAVRDAIAEALGEAYDCTRVWSAWSYGTMGPDDFSLVAEDDSRLGEITDAAISAMSAADADGQKGAAK